ncbi:hypothetical protein QBC44DRAFT_70331 [Cladorrhinum sp. PSN332]|nr:hypothetical protein QBC44DRAFT_70331 [Cladorrhinum sp. PSN332]
MGWDRMGWDGEGFPWKWSCLSLPSNVFILVLFICYYLYEYDFVDLKTKVFFRFSCSEAIPSIVASPFFLLSFLYRSDSYDYRLLLKTDLGGPLSKKAWPCVGTDIIPAANH